MVSNGGNCGCHWPLNPENQWLRTEWVPPQKSVPYSRITSNFLGGWEHCVFICALYKWVSVQQGCISCHIFPFTKKTTLFVWRGLSVPFQQKPVWHNAPKPAAAITAWHQTHTFTKPIFPGCFVERMLSFWLKTKPYYGQAIKEGLLEWGIEAKWQIESVPRLPSATSHLASRGKFRPPRPTNTQSKRVSSTLGWRTCGYGALSDLAAWYTGDVGSRIETLCRASAWPTLSIASQGRGCEEAVDRQRTKLYREALFHVLACQKDEVWMKEAVGQKWLFSLVVVSNKTRSYSENNSGSVYLDRVPYYITRLQ